jgi:hypothetical protein
LEEIEIVETMRGTVFGDASRMSIGCSFSFEPALVTGVLWAMFLGPVPAWRIEARGRYMRQENAPASTARASTAIITNKRLVQREFPEQ